MAKSKRSSFGAVDTISHVRAKLEFLAHVSSGSYEVTPSEDANFGQRLILDECAADLQDSIDALHHQKQQRALEQK